MTWRLVLLVVLLLGPTAVPAASSSPIGDRWELDPGTKRGPFRFTLFRPNYLLLAVGSDEVNQQPSSPKQPPPPSPLGYESIEAAFQLSFKMKAWENMIGDRFDLWFAYTQRSFWQVYAGDISRPFRETNYEPEILVSARTNYRLFGLDGRLAAVGFVHQSNGRSDPLSRSWNRIYAMVALERDRFVLQLKPWYRIREDPTRDDNADIVDHVGWMEILASYTTPRDHSVALLVRTPFQLEPGWGSAEADWRFPISNDLKGYLTAFTGYGESLIDYNFRKTSVGLGISIGSYY